MLRGGAEMNLPLHAFGLFALLASVTFVAAPSLGAKSGVVRNGLVFVTVFVAAALLLAGPASPDPASWALITAAAAVLSLARPWLIGILPPLAALLAAGASDLLRDLGLPLTLSLPVALAGPLVALALVGRHRGFLRVGLRDESLALIAVLGVAVAVSPRLIAGWESAGGLNYGAVVTSAPVAALEATGWVWPFMLLVAAVGAAFALVRSRAR